MINTIEQAYEVIGLALTKHARPTGWSSLVLQTPLFANQCGGVTSIEHTTDGQELDIPIGMDVFEIQRAALFIRDQMLAATGHRIYQLTFTVKSDYKVTLDYGYDRPDGYDDTDTVTIEDAIKRLIAIGVEVDTSNLPWLQQPRSTTH